MREGVTGDGSILRKGIDFALINLALTPNPSPKLGSVVFILGFPQNKKTTRQRGARTGGSGGVRAKES
jgi:hypothetical protein